MRLEGLAHITSNQVTVGGPRPPANYAKGNQPTSLSCAEAYLGKIIIILRHFKERVKLSRYLSFFKTLFFCLLSFCCLQIKSEILKIISPKLYGFLSLGIITD